MNKRNGSVIYFLLGVYSIMISWYYNHNIFIKEHGNSFQIEPKFALLILHYIFWPIYLVYELITGHLSHGMWWIIPESYFK